jgi:hypothetical protein
MGGGMNGIPVHSRWSVALGAARQHSRKPPFKICCGITEADVLAFKKKLLTCHSVDIAKQRASSWWRTRMTRPFVIPERCAMASLCTCARLGKGDK